MDRLGPKPIFQARGKNVDNLCPATTAGMDYIRNPRLFKGLAFNIQERQALGTGNAVYTFLLLI